jgi:L-ribulose-5-phosphate 4-epimerase
VPYPDLTPEHMVVTDMTGKVVEGELRPSSDLATHIVLYQAFPGIGGVAHAHSEYATAWAQARRPIPCFGTTHADYFHGSVPVTDEMTPEEIGGEYEKNTGDVIVRIFRDLDYASIPAVLVANHAPFAWGPTPGAASHNAAILESVARIAYFTANLNPQAPAIAASLHDKHFLRKHGKNAYYGQKSSR